MGVECRCQQRWCPRCQRVSFADSPEYDICGRVAARPNLSFYVSSSSDSKVKLWDLVADQCIDTMDGHSDQVNALRLEWSKLSRSGAGLIPILMMMTMVIMHIGLGTRLEQAG